MEGYYSLCNESKVLINCGCIADDGKVELYHNYNSLQLSKMTIDLAIMNTNDPNNLSKIQDIAVQAEVCNNRYICILYSYLIIFH